LKTDSNGSLEGEIERPLHEFERGADQEEEASDSERDRETARCARE
jgi:hypothetical protein